MRRPLPLLGWFHIVIICPQFTLGHNCLHGIVHPFRRVAVPFEQTLYHHTIFSFIIAKFDSFWGLIVKIIKFFWFFCTIWLLIAMIYIEGQKRPSPLEDLESKISESPATYNWPCRNPRSVSAGASRFWREDTAVTAVERPQRRERWRGTHTSSEGSAIMIHTVAMLSRRRRYCQQCGTGSGSCFQQPGRWFALYIREVVSNRVYHLIPDYGGHKFSTSDRHACGIKSVNFQKRGVLYKQQRI